MRIFQDEHAQEYKSPKPKATADEIRAKGLPFFPFCPFEILGESIVPNNMNVPVILQGTFIQITNLDVERQSQFLLSYFATSPIDYGSSTSKVVLAANFIDGNLNVFNFTDDFKTANLLLITIPSRETVIVGVQYVINSSAALGDPVPVGKEAMGNRGVVALVPGPGTGFLVTTTIRQVFLSSFATPQNVISSTAYSVPNSGGPVVTLRPGTEDLLA